MQWRQGHRTAFIRQMRETEIHRNLRSRSTQDNERVNKGSTGLRYYFAGVGRVSASCQSAEAAHEVGQIVLSGQDDFGCWHAHEGFRVGDVDGSDGRPLVSFGRGRRPGRRDGGAQRPSCRRVLHVRYLIYLADRRCCGVRSGLRVGMRQGPYSLVASEPWPATVQYLELPVSLVAWELHRSRPCFRNTKRALLCLYPYLQSPLGRPSRRVGRVASAPSRSLRSVLRELAEAEGSLREALCTWPASAQKESQLLWPGEEAQGREDDRQLQLQGQLRRDPQPPLVQVHRRHRGRREVRTILPRHFEGGKGRTESGQVHGDMDLDFFPSVFAAL